MAFHARVIEHGAVVLIRAVGPANNDDWFALVERFGNGAEGSGRGLLVDLRRRDTLPTTEEARGIGIELARVASVHFRAMALVVRPGAQFGLARMADQLAGLHGLIAASFNDLSAARDWLCEQLSEPGAGPSV